MATFTARLIGWMHGCGVVDAHALSSQCLLGGSQLLPQQLGLNCEAEADMAANGTSYTLSTMFLPQDLMPSVLQQLRAPPTCPPGSTSQRHGQRYSGLERGRGRGPCCRDHSAALQGGGRRLQTTDRGEHSDRGTGDRWSEIEEADGQQLSWVRPQLMSRRALREINLGRARGRPAACMADWS